MHHDISDGKHGVDTLSLTPIHGRACLGRTFTVLGYREFLLSGLVIFWYPEHTLEKTADVLRRIQVDTQCSAFDFSLYADLVCFKNGRIIWWDRWDWAYWELA